MFEQEYRMNALGVVWGFGLIVLGLGLWFLSGLLKVLDLRRVAPHRLDVQVRTTWMGTLTLRKRVIRGVHGARYRTESEGAGRLELLADGQWVPLQTRYIMRNPAIRRIAEVVQLFVEDGKTPRLALPTRGRMQVMLTFAALFPLGTVSFVIGVLQVLRSLR
jgi:hypothetical protein